MIVLTSIQKEILKKKNNIIKIKYKEKKKITYHFISLLILLLN